MKIIVLKKIAIVIVACVVLVLSAFALNAKVLDVGGVYFTTGKKLPIYSVETEEDKLAISFDAAWGADKTREIMAVCKEYDITATFFLVGFWVEKYPDMVKEIYNNGFEIGVHSSTHPDMTKLNKKQIREELACNIKAVEDLTGFTPKLFRPPFGYYNNDLIDVCQELNLQCIEWSVDSLDWKGLTAGEIASRVTSKAGKGSIVLFHNNSDNIIEGLKMTLQYFKDNKLQVVSIGQLIYNENYTINNQGVQIKK